MSSLKETDVLIRREAALASQLIGSGLTSIRKYDFAFKGVFYSGMFSLTIGFERLLKLIVILNYRNKHGQYPNNDILKKSGHRISKLIKKCIAESSEAISSIKADKELSLYSDIWEDGLIRDIANFMTEFAVSTRYYNLDVITGTIPGKNEPLAEWDSKICSEIIKRHPPSKRRTEQFQEMADMIRTHTTIHHTDESGTHIGDIDIFMKSSMLAYEKQSYSTYYIYRLIYSFVRILIEIDFSLEPQLYLREYFVNLHIPNHTSSSIRKRKIWI